MIRKDILVLAVKIRLIAWGLWRFSERFYKQMAVIWVISTIFRLSFRQGKTVKSLKCSKEKGLF